MADFDKSCGWGDLGYGGGEGDLETAAPTLKRGRANVVPGIDKDLPQPRGGTRSVLNSFAGGRHASEAECPRRAFLQSHHRNHDVIATTK
jgi:hypothetical protein